MNHNIDQPTLRITPPQLSFTFEHLAELPAVYRGIFKQTLKQAGILLDLEWRHPKVSSNVPCFPYFIAPLSDNSYEAILYETNDTTEAQKDYRKMVVGHKDLFLKSVLYTADKPIAIVEGVFDALSVMQVGGYAVALCSISMSNKLMEELTQHKPVQPLYLMLDNDTAGWNATDKLAARLQEANIPFAIAPLDTAYKDPNEALVADPNAFVDCIAQAEKLAKTAADKEASVPVPANNAAPDPITAATTLANPAKSESIDNSDPAPSNAPNPNSILSIYHRWHKKRNDPNKELPTATGFSQLDNLLHGGIHNGKLYVLGAMPGIGKTTFCIQLADQLSQAGKEILFFSLEMSEDQILERLLVQKAGQIELTSHKSCATALRLAEKISCGCPDNEFDDAEKELHEVTGQAFQAYAHNFEIITSISQIKDIHNKVKDRIRQTGHHPVVFIDYLQLIPTSSFLSERAAVDDIVQGIINLKKELNVPVICISSLNRTSYDQPVRMGSFKESGFIEFAADVLLGLQPFYFQQLASQPDSKKSAFEAEQKQAFEKNLSNNIPTQIDLVLLKNRAGKTSTICLLFSHTLGLFSEIPSDTADTKIPRQP